MMKRLKEITDIEKKELDEAEKARTLEELLLATLGGHKIEEGKPISSNQPVYRFDLLEAPFTAELSKYSKRYNGWMLRVTSLHPENTLSKKKENFDFTRIY